MKFSRASGVLLHPTSLPGSGGIGTLGADALRFADFLKDSGFSIWQMLPLGPTGYGDSPYQCFSAFAGNPLLINLPGDEAVPAASNDHVVDFATVIPRKRALLKQQFERFIPDNRYERWVAQQPWLDDFALFSAIKDAHGGNAWTSWAPGLASRDARALQIFRAAHKRQIAQVCFEQYVFFRQFEGLRNHCATRGIALMGDLPIYVAHDSVDVWANRELFQLDPQGNLLVQAGVPPDYFSETGQLWGNPIYNWDVLAKSGYAWWIERMRAALSMFDAVRLDHFRGFDEFWEVPGTATTAVNGRWARGPGAALFNAMTKALGPMPIIAENLGLITPSVEALRKQFGYPGMSILQFAFTVSDEPNEFLPHRYVQETVVYTGTHDNDTTMGWWNATAGADSTRSDEDIESEKQFARTYLGSDGKEMHWTLMRAAIASVADTVLVPMQDILGLGSEARMNLPGRQAGNWQFRFSWDQVTTAIVKRLRDLNALFDRTKPQTK